MIGLGIFAYLLVGIAATYVVCELSPGGSRNNFNLREPILWLLIVSWPVLAVWYTIYYLKTSGK